MRFDYARPSTVAEAAELLSSEGTVALSGGTDLLVALRHRKRTPRLVVDLKAVDGMRDDVRVDDGWLRIGARAVMRSVVDSVGVNTHFPALAHAASVVGSVQIRNRATLAGNLCNASPAADTAPVLLVYRAEVSISGPQGERDVPLTGFFVAPGTTILAPGEIVTGISLPIPDEPLGSAFARVTRRRGVDLASVSVACAVTSSGAVRFGFGAVGPTPLSAETTVEEMQSDEGVTRLLSSTSPISDVRAGADYRRAMLRIHTMRTLERARATAASQDAP